MNVERQQELESVIKSGKPLDEIVALLRRYKDQGVTQAEVYSFLEAIHQASTDDETDDRVLEVADFVAGRCAPHMKVWQDAKT
jgi:hypothetical protein